MGYEILRSGYVSGKYEVYILKAYGLDKLSYKYKVTISNCYFVEHQSYHETLKFAKKQYFKFMRLAKEDVDQREKENEQEEKEQEKLTFWTRIKEKVGL